MERGCGEQVLLLTCLFLLKVPKAPAPATQVLSQPPCWGGNTARQTGSAIPEARGGREGRLTGSALGLVCPTCTQVTLTRLTLPLFCLPGPAPGGFTGKSHLEGPMASSPLPRAQLGNTGKVRMRK